MEPPVRPRKSAVARAARVVHRHISAGIRGISPLCHAYAEHALSVWRLCPGIALLSTHATDASAASMCTGTICFNIVVQKAAPRPPDSPQHDTSSQTNDDSLSCSFPPSTGATGGGGGGKLTPTNPYARVERSLARACSVEHTAGVHALLHHNFVAAVLADVYGIQVRVTLRIPRSAVRAVRSEPG